MTLAITILLWAAGVLLAVSGVLVLVRMAAGPRALDRVVASDVMVAIVIAFVALHSVWLGEATGLPVIVVLTVLGFTGPVAMARLLARSERNRHRFEAESGGKGSAS